MNALVSRVARHPRVVAFALFAVLVYAVEALVVGSSAFARRPGPVAIAVAVDLVLVVPATYWLLVVRSGAAQTRSLVTAFALSLAGARLLLPSGAIEILAYVSYLRWALVPVELGVAAFLLWKLRAMLQRQADRDGDALEAIQRVLAATFGAGLLSEVVGTEIALMRYAFFSFRSRPYAPAGTTPFAHEGSGALTAGLALAIVVESTVLHLLLAAHAPTLGWALTALSAYSLLWLLGDARALALRPVLVGRDTFHVRVGLRHRADVPRALVARVEEPAWNALPAPRPTYLNAGWPGEPNVVVHLSAPTIVRSLFGKQRAVTTIGLRVEAPGALAAALKGSLRAAPTEGCRAPPIG